MAKIKKTILKKTREIVFNALTEKLVNLVIDMIILYLIHYIFK